MGHQHTDETKDRFIYESTLVKVIDGDTIDVNVDLGFKIFHEIRLRLLGIDTPEVRGIEKVAGKESKEALKSLLYMSSAVRGDMDQVDSLKLFIETEKTGKYGRYLATIWLSVEDRGDMTDCDVSDVIETFNGKDWINVNEYMVFHGFAKRYGEK